MKATMTERELAVMVTEVIREQFRAELERAVDARLVAHGLLTASPKLKRFSEADWSIQRSIASHLEATDDRVNRLPLAINALREARVVLLPADLAPPTLARTLAALRRQLQAGSDVLGEHMPEREWRAALVAAQ